MRATAVEKEVDATAIGYYWTMFIPIVRELYL